MASSRVTYLNAQVAAPDEQKATVQLHTTAGESIHGDAFVFACGPWLSKMLPQAVGARIRATRQEVLHFGIPPGDSRFAISRMPVWIDFTAGVYGIPDFDARGFKVGIDRHGAVIDPDTLDRVIDPAVVEQARQSIGRRFPGMAGAPLVDGHVCQYENSSTGDFIIDRHPQWPEAWIVGAGSGHGFKHGPAIGRHLAALVDGKAQVQSRFALAHRGTTAARTVY
jgi:glycine/D-amino acid oxidase-like deaminating enzyme